MAEFAMFSYPLILICNEFVNLVLGQLNAHIYFDYF